MNERFIYSDDIFTNGKGNYFTEQYLKNNFWKEGENGNYIAPYGENEICTKIEKWKEDLKGKTIRCNYSQLFRDDDIILLCNDIIKVDPYLFDNIENGKLYNYYDKDGNEITKEEYEELEDEGDNEIEEQMCNIYQYFLINESLANNLINHTDNIIFYSNKLNLYVLGVTHFGTLWDGVAGNWRW